VEVVRLHHTTLSPKSPRNKRRGYLSFRVRAAQAILVTFPIQPMARDRRTFAMISSKPPQFIFEPFLKDDLLSKGFGHDFGTGVAYMLCSSSLRPPFVCVYNEGLHTFCSYLDAEVKETLKVWISRSAVFFRVASLLVTLFRGFSHSFLQCQTSYLSF
jgi:hypothetical protein